MSRPKRPWFRLYTEMVHDPKIRRLTPAERWLWVTTLSVARSSPVGGYLMLTLNHSWSDVEIAEYADLHLRVVRRGLIKLVDLGMLSWDENLATWQVTNWNDRQFESDDVAERVAKHRYKEKVSNNDVTVLVTASETETEYRDIDREHRQIKTNITNEYESDFAAVWAVVPKRKTDSRKMAHRSYMARRSEGVNADELLTGAKGYRDDPERNAKPQFTMGSAKFFGPGEYWKNYLEPVGYVDNFKVAIGAKQMSDDPNWDASKFYTGEIIKLPGED